MSHFSLHALQRYTERIGEGDPYESFLRARFAGRFHRKRYYIDGNAVFLVVGNSIVTVLTVEQYNNMFDERGAFVGKRRGSASGGSEVSSGDFHE